MFAFGQFGRLVAATGLLLTFTASALAQSAAPAATSQSRSWTFSVYPVLAWIPTNVGIEVNVPADIVGGSGGGIEHAEIIDSQSDGAFIAGSRQPTARGDSTPISCGCPLAATVRTSRTSPSMWRSCVMACNRVCTP